MIGKDKAHVVNVVDTVRSTDRIAYHACAEGRVQGVGFRYWTVQVARAFGITGWVRNCPDNSVEIHAEGKENALREFFSAVQDGNPHAHISHFSISSAHYRGFRSFEVEY